MKIRFMLPLLVALMSYAVSAQSEEKTKNINQLEPFVGNFTHFTRMFPPGKDVITETGELKVEWYLNKTYLKLEAKLIGVDYTRYYTQFIAYNSVSKQYDSIYLYDGTSLKVSETGQFANGKLTLSGKNPFSMLEENGINIKSEFDLSDPNKVVLKVFELNEVGEFKLGYHSIFSRI